MCLSTEMCILEGQNVSTKGNVHIGGGKYVYVSKCAKRKGVNMSK